MDHKLIFDVVPDERSFIFLDADRSGTPGGGDPFLLEGKIFAVGERSAPIGSFVRHGTFCTPEDGGNHAIVSEACVFAGRGSLFLDGFLPGKTLGLAGLRRAISGGTGEFSSLQGEATVEELCGEDLAFQLSVIVPVEDPPEPPVRFWSGLRTLIVTVLHQALSRGSDTEPQKSNSYRG